jgi:hypothetical protein
MRYIVLFASLFMFIFWACEDHSAHLTETQRWEEVMAVHDSIMPEMSTINRQKRQLKAHLENEALLASNPELELILLQTIRQLGKAEDGMMEWMAEARAPEKLRDSLSHEEIVIYLSVEKQKIEIVKEDMVDAMEAGAGLLELIELKQTEQEEE